ncbi:hypothetical protein GPECTOR_29g118 [Gonium pectorale]|uniref:Cytochrome b5 heme-binding domain-containing protein n=1 Tax=Gonium pectorale TaxID=33097 RepID=A0A150GEF2_GONPE|nr:hypothetical protein GPECTOR_29g118 [Gonium pectorale]|eukprot:KXZ48212.1 hypothetical protein GPECTOR_29g118 [Gonium pectorale]
MSPLLQALIAVAVLAVVFLFVLRARSSPAPPAPEKYQLGDVTVETLRLYNGYDWSKPPLVAVKGKVYDVSNKYELYGPGKPKNAYAGREVARALALDYLEEKDLGADLEGLTPKQLQRLEEAVADNDNLEGLAYAEMGNLRDWIGKFNYKYPIVGKVVG